MKEMNTHRNIFHLKIVLHSLTCANEKNAISFQRKLAKHSLEGEKLCGTKEGLRRSGILPSITKFISFVSEIRI